MKKHNNSRVSVIIPTYKRPDTLDRAIASVENSTYKNVEIIVVDDNNPDDDYRKQTEEKMTKILDKYSNVKYIKHEFNKNGSAARNTGIKNSTGDYLMFLDDDDEFLPDKIKSQVEFLDGHDNTWGACYTKYIDKSNGKILRSSCENRSGNLLKYELARNLFVHAGSNLMVRKTVALEINGFDESFKRNQDVEFLVRILKKYKLGYVDCLGLVVYLHKANNSIDFFELTKQYLNKFKPFIEELPIKDQEEINKMIALQEIRHAFEKKQIKKFFRIKKESKIKLYQIINYFGHLTKRMISKKAYGYNMERL